MRTAIALVGAIALAGGGVIAATQIASAATPDTPGSSLIADAGEALKNNAATLRTSAQDEYRVYSSKTDREGRGTVRYTRTYQGLRVYGGDLVVRTKANGDYAGSSVGLTKPLSLATKPTVVAAQAARTATAEFEGKVTSTGTPELFVDASSGTGKLSYDTLVSGWQPDGQTPSRLHVITDATSGAVVGSHDEIHSVAGTGNSVYSGQVPIETTLSGSTYSLTDPLRGNGSTCDMQNRTSGTCAVLTDADNTWGNGAATDRQSAAVDAHFGAAVTFDYFKNVHGRNGIFGNGQGVPSRVHYGNAYVNAFWDGRQMTYGDGAGNTKPLVSLDVAGHEMSHGVTDAVVPGGLTYSGESGGLNEATSDIFGSLVEFHANTAEDPGDYGIGEELGLAGTGKPLRYMYNPTLDGSSHGCWSSTTRSIDVHYSSGVANHFFFNLAEGTGATAFGTSPVCGSAEAVVGIGRDKAAKIWFRALDTYFVSNTGYVNTANPGNTARAYTLAAAADLYGLCGTEYKAVRAAWTSVNVAGNDVCSAGNDFSLTLSAPNTAVDPGASVTLTATTAVVNGTAETVTFSAGSTPTGVTVSFDPPTVTAGEPSTVTVTAADGIDAGVAPITITATAASMTRSATLTVTTNSGPGCNGSNLQTVTVPDNATVTSPITVSGCDGPPSATSAVTVNIRHTYIGDLAVTLLAPDGTGYVLHNRSGGTNDNINQTFTVDLSSETANGTWTLQVRDAATLDSGALEGWKLSL